MINSRVQQLLTTITMGEVRFLYGLDQMPDDRLTWSPGGAAKTPLQLAGKLAEFLAFVSHIVGHRELPTEEDLTQEPTTREEAKLMVANAFVRLYAVVNALTEADLARKVSTPWGQIIPQGALLWWVNGIVLYHQGQLNYCQLCYGDTDPNLPPEWGAETAGE